MGKGFPVEQHILALAGGGHSIIQAYKLSRFISQRIISRAVLRSASVVHFGYRIARI